MNTIWNLPTTHVRPFADIDEHRPVALLTSGPRGREGLINMKVVDAAYENARTGQVVAIS